ncbi:hypothetical protein Nepgr_004831 [Nepenthes gracilis]|uniref:Uncharacterized protein n=1 Tax=Nepenthes gracilis TaxID=150966 RepID=A0AAD3S285_NEPGR|nr:hypothetical protein Nepgr_004831 [Nepenthes gracilis]
MAVSKLLSALLLLSLLVLAHLAQAIQTASSSNSPSPPAGNLGSPGSKIDCGSACVARCRRSKRPRLCQRSCHSCCSRCDCVPPGTSGNYDACPCYASIITRGNKRKCP